MSKLDLCSISGVEISNLIKSKSISISEVKEFFDQRKSEHNPIINAFKHNDFFLKDEISKLQNKIDRCELSSPLAGLPIAIKDNINIKGVNISCGSKMLENYVSPYDAHVISQIKESGLYVSDITNMDEFAMGSTTETCAFGAVKNPWDINKSPGGSSGGSAAAVSSKMSILALGSDTGGSVRQPASFCGVVGLKPTYGLISRYGLVSFASSFDQIGPMASHVTDVAALLDIIQGEDKRDATCIKKERTNHYEYLSKKINEAKSIDKPLDGIKIAVLDKCIDESFKSEISENLIEFTKTIEKLGGICEVVKFPLLDYAVATYYIISSAQASSNLARYDGVKYTSSDKLSNEINELYLKTRKKYFGDETIRRILLGSFVLSSGYFDEYYMTALKANRLIKDEATKILDEYDAVLCPSSMISAPKLGESLKDPLKMYLSDLFTVVANLTGLPAISIPSGFDKNNMPIGMQLMGKAYDEKTLLYIAGVYQLVTDHHLKGAKFANIKIGD